MGPWPVTETIHGLVSWTDGTPTSSGTNTNGVYVWGVGHGFSVQAPADADVREPWWYTWEGGQAGEADRIPIGQFSGGLHGRYPNRKRAVRWQLHLDLCSVQAGANIDGNLGNELRSRERNVERGGVALMFAFSVYGEPTYNRLKRLPAPKWLVG